jgi:adenine-specific DNA-methyltransferase
VEVYMATDNLVRLRELLEELFQFGSADLDFGIYRVMRRKRAEVRRFLDCGLAQIVDDALSGGVAAQQASLASELEEVAEQIRQNLAADAISDEGELRPALRETNLGRRYEELRARAEGAVDLESLKGIVFNHVHTFFGRYYEGGDFLSKRRYSRRQRYAIPYNGEEVYLHWANSDQYYVKTAEHFTDYSYTTADGAAVRFELVEADTEQNYVKGERRFFVPHLSDLRFKEEARELTVPFQYRPLNEQETKAFGNQRQQEKIVEQVVEEMPKRLTENATALAIVEPPDLLRKHLNRYTRRNTSDYFVQRT